ncbi:hypothetical protein AX16_004474 [Volvariella volvacea WC 439]|nr:hypothetical protein AX16_004474 [Volvariella volvacea WC 439]
MPSSTRTSSSNSIRTTTPRRSDASSEGRSFIVLPSKPDEAHLAQRKDREENDMNDILQAMNLELISFKSNSKANKPNVLKVFAQTSIRRAHKYRLPLTEAKHTTKELSGMTPISFKLGMKRLGNHNISSAIKLGTCISNSNEAYLAHELADLSGDSDLVLQFPEGELTLRVSLSFPNNQAVKEATSKLYAKVYNNFRAGISSLDNCLRGDLNDETRHKIYIVRGALQIPLRLMNHDHDFLHRAIKSSSDVLSYVESVEKIALQEPNQIQKALLTAFEQTVMFFAAFSPSFKGWYPVNAVSSSNDSAQKRSSTSIEVIAMAQNFYSRPNISQLFEQESVSKLQKDHPVLTNLIFDDYYLFPPKSIHSGKHSETSVPSQESTQSLAETIMDWIGNPTAQRVLFAYSNRGTSGYAGTCMSTLVPALHSLRCLGAFAYLPPNTTDEQSLIQVIHCLALQLCYHDEELANCIKAVIENDPKVLEASALKQADALLGTPLQTFRADKGRCTPLVIMIGNQDEQLTALDVYMCRLCQSPELRPFVRFVRFMSQESYELVLTGCHDHHEIWTLDLNFKDNNRKAAVRSKGKESNATGGVSASEGGLKMKSGGHTLSTEAPKETQSPIAIMITSAE